MSFLNQRDVRYLVNQFYYWLLIRFIKTPAMLKHPQFEDSGSDEIELRGSKCQRLHEHNKEEANGLDENEGEIKSARYISPPFIPLSLLQKVLNHLSDLDKGTKSLNYFVCIPKICYSRSPNFALEFPSRGDWKAQKKIYTSRVRERLESHLAFTASTASSTTNYHCPIKKRLECHLPSNHLQDLQTQLCAHKRQGAGS